MGKKKTTFCESSSRLTRSKAGSFEILADCDDDFPTLGKSLASPGNSENVGRPVSNLNGKTATGGSTAVSLTPSKAAATITGKPTQTREQPPAVENLTAGNGTPGIEKGAVAQTEMNATAVTKALLPAVKQPEIKRKTTTPIPWNALFKDNRDPRHGIKLRYVPPKGDTLDFGDRLLPSMVDMWGYCLVGHFTGKFPGLKTVHDLKVKWSVPCLVRSHKKGWVIFKFHNEDDRSKVLLGGPYIVFGKLLMLKELSENFSFEDEEFLKVPIWVKFHDLPLQLWNDEAMSEVASMVGVPLTTDKITQERINNDYARVLIEVDVSKPPPLLFPIRLPSQKVIKQSVVYETFPSYCFHCKDFGHNPFICKKFSKSGAGVEKEKEKNVVTLDEIEGVGAASGRPDSAQGLNLTGLAPNPTGPPLVSAQVPPPRTMDPTGSGGQSAKQGPASPAIDQRPIVLPTGDQNDAKVRIVSKEGELKKDDVFKCDIIDGKTLNLFVKPLRHVQASVTRVDRFLQFTDDLDKRGLTFTDQCIESLPGFTMKKGEVDFGAKFANPFHVFFGC
ncbi:unnamed protein product [Cuscuta europaea]|uniref:DUF4283 domain-containing protein n=1 Tax=Cuscuta europaea TaxID=41803 RepID=A0A9P0ZTK9_CUSEU|nr:unnamed protein product [Cuscuta europaea]